jgi:hypothetical protein
MLVHCGRPRKVNSCRAESRHVEISVKAGSKLRVILNREGGPTDGIGVYSCSTPGELRRTRSFSVVETVRSCVPSGTRCKTCRKSNVPGACNVDRPNIDREPGRKADRAGACGAARMVEGEERSINNAAALQPLEALEALEPLRSSDTLEPLVTLRSGIALESLRPLQSLETLRSLETLQALRPLDTRARDALKALQPLEPLWALNSRTRQALESLSTLDAGNSLIALRTLNAGTSEALEALIALDSINPLKALGSLKSGTGQALEALIALDSERSLISLRALNASSSETLIALRALRSRGARIRTLEALLTLSAGPATTAGSYRPCRALWTGAATAAARDERPSRRRHEERDQLSEILSEDDGVGVKNTPIRHLD